MTHALDGSIEELLAASRDDEETLSLPVNDRTFGLHAQQAIEKLLKALIAAHGDEYPFTHNIESLIRDVQALGETLPIPTAPLVLLTKYAGLWRYQAPAPLAVNDRAVLTDAVASLRAYTLARLLILRPDFDWTAYK